MLPMANETWKLRNISKHKPRIKKKIGSYTNPATNEFKKVTYVSMNINNLCVSSFLAL